MLPEIALDVLHYLDRTALEGLQTQSRYLKDLVDRHSRTLPLRRIYRAEVLDGHVHVSLTKEDQRITIPTSDERDPEAVFNRVNNMFIRRLVLSFCRDNTPIFNHLRAKVNSLQCQIRSLRVDGAASGIDYALVDFLGAHLKPRTYATTVGDEKDCTMLFTHRALRGNVMHLMYQFTSRPPPDCIIQEFVGVDVVESCAMSTRVDPRPWIGKFVEMFENAERGPNIIREVTLLHARFGQPMPLPLAFDPLGQPWRTNIATEPSHFVKEWSRVTDRAYGVTTVESPVADFFIFRNAKAAQKLGIFAWTIEQRKNDAQTSFHYAYLLRVIDM